MGGSWQRWSLFHTLLPTPNTNTFLHRKPTPWMVPKFNTEVSFPRCLIECYTQTHFTTRTMRQLQADPGQLCTCLARPLLVTISPTPLQLSSALTGSELQSHHILECIYSRNNSLFFCLLPDTVNPSQFHELIELYKHEIVC